MFTSYIKIAWRNLVRNKTFSLVNIMGLALGMVCSLLIMLWVWDEKSVDAFHQNNETLYQVYERSSYDGKNEASYSTQGLLAEELKRKVSDIAFSSAFEYVAAPGNKSNFSTGDKLNKMPGFWAGEDFFKMFSYPLVEGSQEAVLKNPGAIAVSQRMAEVFFGGAAQAMGKTILFEGKTNLTVTAVFENLPSNSSMQFDFIRNYSDFLKENQWAHHWGNTSPQTFIQLKPQADAATVEKKIAGFLNDYRKTDPGLTVSLALQPNSEKYLYSHFSDGKVDGGRIEYVRLFSIVAVFILLIACINFMNLATARSTKRAKEVGLRKVVGAMRFSLVTQFLGEAIMLAFFSATVALALMIMALPAFNHLTGKQLALPFAQPAFWLSVVGLILLTGVIAGSYPALFLSSLNPVKVLKGTLKFKWSATFFRQSLVVFQFAMSIILIVGMMVIYRQVKFIQTKNTGYDRENLVYIPIEGELMDKYALFKQQALQGHGILNISKMRNSPTVIEHHTGSIAWQGKDANQAVSFADGVVGYDFARTLNLEFTEGRDFSDQFGMDSASYLINETALQKMGFKNPIGETVSWNNRQGKIIGVLKDFHFNSIHQAIDPLILRLDDKWSYGTILVRVEAGKTKEAVAALEKISKNINPNVPFTYSFSDEEYFKLYQSEQLVETLSNYFAALAIFISCLGLFGLATFMVSQRTKEIGVRKVLGASVASIISMLCGQFVKLVLLAGCIAFPIAWYIMNDWLQHFESKADITAWVFIIAGGATLLIALLTISYQSIQAALSNPVKSLRTE